MFYLPSKKFYLQILLLETSQIGPADIMLNVIRQITGRHTPSKHHIVHRIERNSTCSRDHTDGCWSEREVEGREQGMGDAVQRHEFQLG